MQRHSIYIATLGLLLTSLSACQHAQPSPTSAHPGNAADPPEIVPASTIPPGINGNDIRGPDPETIRAIEQINREGPGFACGINGTYGEQIPGTYNAFRVAEGEPFIGRFDLWNGMPEAHTFVIACLVDHLQTPCTPDAPFVQLSPLDANQRVQLPLEIPDLTRGLHDFSVTFWHDPYAGQYDQFPANRARVSLFVGGDTRPPVSVTYQDSPGQPLHRLDWVRISQKRDPRKKDGSIEDEVYMRVPAGEQFNFFLHLNNKNNVDVDMALTAFLDYKQVPIYWREEAHMPLYIHNRAQTWQPMAVQVCAPDEPGRYEFMVIGTAFPFARLDLNTHYGLDSPIGNAYSSHRILLQVE